MSESNGKFMYVCVCASLNEVYRRRAKPVAAAISFVMFFAVFCIMVTKKDQMQDEEAEEEKKNYAKCR